MSLDVRRDNEAALAWLDGALRYAIARGQLALIAYLESVLDDRFSRPHTPPKMQEEDSSFNVLQPYCNRVGTQ